MEDEHRRIELVNQTFCDLFSIPAPPTALIGADCSQAAEQSAPLFADPEAFVHRVNALLAARRQVTGDVLTMADGRVVERDYIPIFIDENYRGHLWKYRDITARVRESRRQNLLNELSQALVDVELEDEAYRRAMTVLTAGLNWPLGAAYAAVPRTDFVDRTRPAETSVMRTVAAVSAPGVAPETTAAYTRGLDTQTFSRGEGLPGRVWDTGRAESFARAADIVSRDGLSAMVLIPVTAASGVLGVFELASTQPRQVDAADLALLLHAGERIGRVVERIRAHQKRRATSRWMQMVIDGMMEGLLVVQEADGIIAFVNPFAERLFGFAPGEMAGRHVRELVAAQHASDPAFFERAYRQSISTTTEWNARRKDGTEFAIELQLTEFDPGEGRLFVGFIRDLSDRQAIERMKKEFVSTVSHELRTPLTSIRAALGLLDGGVAGHLNDDARELVGVASHSVVRLIGLINDILDLERAEGQMGLSLSTRAIDLDAVVNRAAAGVSAFAGEHGVQLDILPSGLHVTADPARVEQVLVNLISNAVKFSPMGDTVTVRCRKGSGMAHVDVLDRGPGVPEDFRSIIFEPFRQVASADNRDRGGSGLGLTISRAIVRQHGGDIGLEDRDGGGSVFWFTLPLAPEPPA